MPSPVAAPSAPGRSLPSARTTLSRRTTACTTADRAKPRISAQRISQVIAPAIARACHNQSIIASGYLDRLRSAGSAVPAHRGALAERAQQPLAGLLAAAARL